MCHSSSRSKTHRLPSLYLEPRVVAHAASEESSLFRFSTNTRRKEPLGRYQHCAVTLIELLVVVMIIGVMTAVVVGRLGLPSIGNPGAQATARRLALDLRLARISAITERSHHYVGFDVAGSVLTGYTVYRVASPSDVAVESYRTLDRGITITSGAVRAEFNPAGQALGSYSFTVSGPTRDYTVNVIAATGTVTVSGP